MARRDQVRYGGNTTCLHFHTRSGQDLILDAGSGIRLLGDRMVHRQRAGTSRDRPHDGRPEYGDAAFADGRFAEGRGEATILIGHTHWDHILGFPFFSPLYIKGNRFLVVSAGQKRAHIRDILSGQQAGLNFPVSTEQWAASLDYLPCSPGDELELREFHVETVQLNHPGITLGYRIAADDGVVTVYTDAARVREVRLGDGMKGPKPDEGFSKAYLERLAYTARNSNVLVHDSHFREREMVERLHYGHSTVEDALEIARLAKVQQLILFHHAPEHSDAVVDEKLALARDLSVGEPLKVDAATEGTRVQVGVGVTKKLRSARDSQA
jgi:ribonuclease BN (tRNA processing enzyme)